MYKRILENCAVIHDMIEEGKLKSDFDIWSTFITCAKEPPYVIADIEMLRVYHPAIDYDTIVTKFYIHYQPTVLESCSDHLNKYKISISKFIFWHDKKGESVEMYINKYDTKYLEVYYSAPSKKRISEYVRNLFFDHSLYFIRKMKKEGEL